MTADFTAGLSAFKILYDSAKALKDINDGTIRNAAVIELQEKILSAQEAQFILVERVHELEKQLSAFETWETDKIRYEMQITAAGGVIYALKTNIRPSEPPHMICANCYANGKKSILQKEVSNDVRRQLGFPSTLKCQNCDTSVLA